MYNVLILAGGEQTRFSEISKEIPKVFYQVENNIPFVQYMMENINSSIGPCKFFFLVKDHFVESYGIEASLKFDCEFIYEKEKLGTGGAVLAAMNRERLKEAIVINGDTYCNVNWKKLCTSSFTKSLKVVVGNEENGNGNIRLNKNQGLLVRDKTNYINQGVYILKKDFFEGVLSSSFSLETIMEKKLFDVFFNEMSGFYDIGTVQGFNHFKKQYLFNERE